MYDLRLKKIKKIEYFDLNKREFNKLKVVECDNIEYSYKSENREKLNSLKVNGYDEVIIVKNGLVTDTTISNLAFFDGKEWHTPKNPLLKGTKREELIQKGFLKEKDIKIDNVKNYFEAKNGTAIVFVTHSGRIIETYLKNSLLKDFLKIINDPDTSFPFLYNLDRVMSKLNWNGIFTFGELENQLDILKNEVARLLKRTLKSILPHDKYNNLLEFLLNSIKMYINKNRRNYRFDYISYINLLKISEEIKRCVKSSS